MSEFADSANPSIRPMVAILAFRTLNMKTGRSPRIIADDTAARELTKPSAATLGESCFKEPVLEVGQTRLALASETDN